MNTRLFCMCLYRRYKDFHSYTDSSMSFPLGSGLMDVHLVYSVKAAWARGYILKQGKELLSPETTEQGRNRSGSCWSRKKRKNDDGTWESETHIVLKQSWERCTLNRGVRFFKKFWVIWGDNQIKYHSQNTLLLNCSVLTNCHKKDWGTKHVTQLLQHNFGFGVGLQPIGLEYS